MLWLLVFISLFANFRNNCLFFILSPRLQDLTYKFLYELTFWNSFSCISHTNTFVISFHISNIRIRLRDILIFAH